MEAKEASLDLKIGKDCKNKPVAARKSEMGVLKPWCNTFLQLPYQLQITDHPKNRKHKQTNQPEIHKPRRHERDTIRRCHRSVWDLEIVDSKLLNRHHYTRWTKIPYRQSGPDKTPTSGAASPRERAAWAPNWRYVSNRPKASLLRRQLRRAEKQQRAKDSDGNATL